MQIAYLPVKNTQKIYKEYTRNTRQITHNRHEVSEQIPLSFQGIAISENVSPKETLQAKNRFY